MTRAQVPRVIVLGGCNGAGKTTAARTLLAETLGVMTFVNADAIAQGLSGFDPTSAAVEASRIMLERLHALAERRESFGFETTLAARSYVSFLRRLKSEGYIVQLHFYWLDNPDLNVQRVALRVRAGGHAVPEATIRQRYGRSVRNFLDLYRALADRWELQDNSDPNLVHLIAESGPAGEVIHDPAGWAKFVASAGHE